MVRVLGLVVAGVVVSSSRSRSRSRTRSRSSSSSSRSSSSSSNSSSSRTAKRQSHPTPSLFQTPDGIAGFNMSSLCHLFWFRPL